MKKPVIFYHFDVDRQLKAHGSYLSFDTELFGEVAKTDEDVFKALHVCMEKRVENTCMPGKQFEYSDRNNCQRTYNAISALYR